MTNRYPAHRYRDAFTAQLRGLYHECGVTSLAELAATCKRLPELHPEFYPQGKEAPEYVKSTFSTILNGRRPGLPSPRFVKAYVLCCLAIGRENGLQEPGPGRLREWQEKLQKFADDSHSDGLPAWRGYRPGPDPWIQEQWFRSADASATFDTTWELAVLAALTVEQEKTIAAYGPYGRTLLQRIRQGDPHAIYQGALLLTGRRDGDEGIAVVLTAAGTVGHREALELLQADADRIDRIVARKQAFRMAGLAEKAGNPDAVRAFYVCATLLEDLTRPDPLQSSDNRTQEQPPA